MEVASKARYGYIVAMVGMVLYVLLDIVAQMLPPHYSPISQAESDLAVGPFGYIMTINFVNRCAFSLAFIYAFAETAAAAGEGSSRYRTGTALLAAWAVGALLLAIFPTDVPATPVSAHGAVHLVVAVIAFLTGGFGTLAVSLVMGGSQATSSLRRLALPLSVIVVLLCLFELGVPFAFHHLSLRFGGLFERMFLGSVILWMGVVSCYFLTHSRLLESRTHGA